MTIAAFNESPRRDITWGGGKASCLPNLGTRWATCPSCFPRHSQNMRLDEQQCRSGLFEEQENLVASTGKRTAFLGPLAQSLVTIPTELCCSCSSSNNNNNNNNNNNMVTPDDSNVNTNETELS